MYLIFVKLVKVQHKKEEPRYVFIKTMEHFSASKTEVTLFAGNWFWLLIIMVSELISLGKINSACFLSFVSPKLYRCIRFDLCKQHEN